mmetsp:Transcript_26002/g.61144  ORF Transcript_26002/g.61144 Transcript_26002/m.61144 type:complete len:222 (-) Transcript_26002:89-754(-)
MPSILRKLCVVSCILSVATDCHGLSQKDPSVSRRAAFVQTTSVVAAGLVTAGTSSVNSAVAAPDLKFQTSSSGIQWADARVGTGNPLKPGGTATIDYVMSTTGARYGTKIYSTADLDKPYRWTLGDGSTIAGIEQAILGDGDSLVPMRPGGIRRVVIPQSLGYSKLATDARNLCVENGSPGPIPSPKDAFEEYQRFKNIYCNSDRQYQPDIVMDVKLYGQR